VYQLSEKSANLPVVPGRKLRTVRSQAALVINRRTPVLTNWAAKIETMISLDY